MTNLERFQNQFERCTRTPVLHQEQPLTGIEKEQAEQDEAAAMYEELKTIQQS